MSPDEMTEALGEKALAVQIGPAPLEQMRRNVARKRNRTRAALSAAGLAAVLVVGVALIAQHQGVQREAVENGPTTSTAPAPPDGMKFVGLRSVVVAVPESWGTYNTLCNSARSDGVYFGLGELNCLKNESAGSPVLILDLASTDGRQLAELTTDQSVINGVEVRRELVECPDTGFCIRRAQEVLVVPSEGVVVTVPKGGSSSDVLDTLQLLPDGFTTVPSLAPGTFFNEAVGAMEGQGLEARPVFSGVNPKVLSTQPAAGSVIREGDSVLLEVREPDPMTIGPMTATPTTATPGEIVALTFTGEEMRGIAFHLTSDATSERYTLISDWGDPGKDPSWFSDSGGWVDVGISGPGPDRVVIPEVAEPGSYQLCTANAKREMCVAIEVVGEPEVSIGEDGEVAVEDILGTWQIKSMAWVTDDGELRPRGDYLQPEELTVTFTPTSWSLSNGQCNYMGQDYTLDGRDISYHGEIATAIGYCSGNAERDGYSNAGGVIMAATHLTATTLQSGRVQLYFHEDNWRIVMALER